MTELRGNPFSTLHDFTVNDESARAPLANAQHKIESHANKRATQPVNLDAANGFNCVAGYKDRQDRRNYFSKITCPNPILG